jgi:hypothetical protein
MKIFLNNRTVEFTDTAPTDANPADKVVIFESPGLLSDEWNDFERYEKFRRFILVCPRGEDPLKGIDPELPPDFRMQGRGFIEFAKLFKYIPAAGGLVKNEKGEYLFIHRLGFWDLPKGKIDRSDADGLEEGIHDPVAAERAAVREVREETGLKSMIIKNRLPSTWHIYTAREKRILKQTTWFGMEAEGSQVLKPCTSEGIFLAKWTPAGGIHCILTHTYASIRDLLLEVVF